GDFGARRRLETVVAYRLLTEHVHAEQPHRARGTARFDQRHVAFDHGRRAAELAEPAERRHERLVYPQPWTHDFQRGAATHRVERALEAGDRARVGDLDRDDHGDPERDAGDRRRAADGLAREPAQDHPAEQTNHGRSPASRPSRIGTTRPDAAATSGAWVAS